MRERRAQKLNRLSRWMIGLLAIIAGLVQPVQAQANYGCLEIFKGAHIGRYDLTKGVYTDLKPDESANKQVTSPENQKTAFVDNSGQLIVKSGKSQQSFKFPSGVSDHTAPIWSPNSRYLALIVTLSQGDAQLAIAALDEKSLFLFKLTDPAQATIHSGEYLEALSWSPDSRYVAVPEHHADLHDGAANGYYTVAINLFSTDGKALGRVVEKAVGYQLCGEVCDLHDPFEWSADSSSIFYVEHVPGSSTSLNAMAYRIAPKRTDRLATALTDYPIYGPDKRYALIQWVTSGTRNAGVLDTANAKMILLDSDKSPLDLAWIGKRALVRRESYLLWTNADATGKHRIDVSPEHLDIEPRLFVPGGPPSAAYSRMMRYQVSRDGQWLVFDTQATHGDAPESTVWVANLATGKTMRWVDFSIFDGVQFISPDSRVMVMQERGLDEGQLYLLPFNGQRRKITLDEAKHPLDIYQIVWTPDNLRFVIVPALGPDGNLYVIGVNGQMLKHYRNFPYLGEPVRFTAHWSDCR